MALRKKTTNAAALEATLNRLADAGHIEEGIDDASVQALRSMARALDDDPSKAALWREYRDTLAEVRRRDDNAIDDLKDAIAEIDGAAEMGNASQA